MSKLTADSADFTDLFLRTLCCAAIICIICVICGKKQSVICGKKKGKKYETRNLEDSDSDGDIHLDGGTDRNGNQFVH
jgi:hypothetical protein